MDHGSPISTELRANYEWRGDWLPNAIPRPIDLHAKIPIVLYADAEGSGHGAAGVSDGSQSASCVTHTHLPQWIRGPNLDTAIFEFDLAAISLGVYIAVDLFPGRPILIGADNQGAWGAAIRRT